MEVTLYGLAAEDIDVVCPRCAGRAVVVVRQQQGAWPASWPRRLVCRGCGHTADWESAGRSSWWGVPVDPFFRLPLWLSAPCCGSVLWAFNTTHLDVLEAYVEATLRKRAPRMVTRLPGWMTAAKHRAEVLRVIGRLRAKI